MKITKQFVSKHLAAVVALIFLSALIIFYNYLSIPQNLSYDEIEFAQLALSLDKPAYSVYSPLASGHSTLYFYILLASFKLFGVSNFALRFPSALFGLITIPIFYLVMNKVFKNSLLAFLLASTLLSLRWYFNFARFSFEATFLLFLELIATLFLFKFLDSKKKYFLILSAAGAGAAFHSYLPGRIFFILLLIFLLFQKAKKYALLFIIIFGLIASPLVIYLTQHPDTRLSQISILSNYKLTSSEKISQIAQNVKKTSLMFHLQGDMNGRHNFPGKPALNSILGILFLIGFAVALRNYSKFSNRFFLFYFILSLIPSLLTRSQDNPNMLRTVTAVIPIVYFVGCAYSQMWQLTKRFRKVFIAAFIAATFIASSFYEVRTYFLFQSRVFKNSFEIQCDLPKVIHYKRETIPKECRVAKNLF